MSKTVRTEAVDHLFDAILTLETKEECYTFFEDVCTINELLSLSQRFEVAVIRVKDGTNVTVTLSPSAFLSWKAASVIFSQLKSIRL